MTRPYAAHTKKGKLRARMARELLAAHLPKPTTAQETP